MSDDGPSGSSDASPPPGTPFPFQQGPTTDSDLKVWLSANMPRSSDGTSSFGGEISGDQGQGIGTRPGRGFLVNLDSRPGSRSFIGGTHWTGAFIPKEIPRAILYYDSLGMAPPQSITDHARRNQMVVLSSADQHQRFDSPEDQQCGQRACFALRDMATDGLRAFESLLGGTPPRVRG